MAKNRNIQSAGSGMNRDVHPQNLGDQEYHVALNANIENENGDIGTIQNEPSNLLCTRFAGFKVVGYVNDYNENGVFFFLANPNNGLSKITYLQSINEIDIEADLCNDHHYEGVDEDILVENCSVVDSYRELPIPLEELAERYTEICKTMVILLEDDVDDKCLNFSVCHPIRKIVIKDEKCGKSIYWTDGYNPPRYLNLKKLEEGWYGYRGEIICGSDAEVEYVQVACEKLRIFPLLDIPCIEVETIQYGGSLRAGTYEFGVALSDQFGNELTSYYSLTNPVHIFDRNDIVIRDGIWGKNTGLGIKLTVRNLDSQISHYKVAVIQRTVGYNGEVQPVEEYFIVGVFPISQQSVLYTTDQNLLRTSLPHLALQKQIYNTAQGLTSTGGRLLLYSIEVEKEWNLQPIANLLGSFMYCQSSLATEELYKSGEAVEKYASYMRDEVYPLSITFLTDYGYITSKFPLIPRPAYSWEEAVIVDENGNVTDERYRQEVESILKNVPNCSTSSRNQYWQFYNTAQELGNFPGVTPKECDDTVVIRESQRIDFDYSFYNPTASSEKCLSLEALGKTEDDEILDVINDSLPAYCRTDGRYTTICEIFAGNAPAEWQLPKPDVIFPEGCDTPYHEVSLDNVYIQNIDFQSYNYTYVNPQNIRNIPKDNLIKAKYEQSGKYYLMFLDLLQDVDIEDLPALGDCSILNNARVMAELTTMYATNAENSGRSCAYADEVTFAYYENERFPGYTVDRYDSQVHYGNYFRVLFLRNDKNVSAATYAASIALMIMTDDRTTSSTIICNNEDDGGLVDYGACADFYLDLITDYNTGVYTYRKTNGYSKLISYDELNPDAPGGVPRFFQATYYFFHRNVSKNAKWMYIQRPEEWDDPETIENSKFLILEIGGYAYDESLIDSTTSPEVRVTFFTDCSGTLHPNPLNEDLAKTGIILRYERTYRIVLDEDFFKDENGETINRVYMSLDAGITYTTSGINYCGERECFAGMSSFTGTLPGQYGVALRKKEIGLVNFCFNSISFGKEETYYSNCELCAEKDLNCDAIAYKYYDFSYWESTEKYPPNNQLYDSTIVKIDRNLLDPEVFDRLNEFYELIQEADGYYYPSNKANFCQKNIRHYKFPDNSVSNFMTNQSLSVNAEANIFPIGLFINDDVVKQFLDVAVLNGMITQDQRDAITGYEIWRGDRKLNRSVIGTGLAYDMFNYTDLTGYNVLYSNYPYNDLSEDSFRYTDENRKTYIQHPYNKTGNCRYTFHSPDFHFNRPDAPVECKIEGYQHGYSVGCFPEVINHPKWVILGAKAEERASTFARLETLAETLSKLADLAFYLALVTVNGAGGGIGGIVGGAAAIAILTPIIVRAQNAVEGSEYVKYGLRRYEWLEIFKNNGQLKNFAYYYTSTGLYNSFMENTQQGSGLRGLSVSRYLPRGRFMITDPGENSEVYKINNVDRESSMFLSFGNGRNITYPVSVRDFDYSRVEDLCYTTLEADKKTEVYDIPEQISRICSPYMRMKYYVPSQYGGIDNVVWIPTGKCHLFNEDNPNRVIFGGDTYISRFSLKRKIPFFHTTAFGLADRTPFMYNDYRNAGFPRYYVNFDSIDSEFVYQGNEFPAKQSLYNLNCARGDFYVSGKFYLYSYGIPQFLVESEINCNFRLIPGRDYYEDFYPNVGDYIEWTQQKNVAIELDNVYSYHPIFNEVRHRLGWRRLESTYDKEFYDCAYQMPSGGAWSQEDVSENSMIDPWLVFKPNDRHEFATENGKLIDIKGIESNQTLVRFENQVELHNAIDILRDRITPNNEELGTGGLFAGRPLKYNTTDLGYAGTQSVEIVSTEFGHFWVDAKRGQMFMVLPNGRELKEISPGVRNWLKKHLPFKILNSNITNLETEEPMTYEDVDNKFAGLGLALGYDNKYKRVLVTKKDYIPTKNVSFYTYSNCKFYYRGAEIQLTDPDYFQDVSFTIGYNLLKGEWVSYYSYTPDYYIEHMHYFQSGLNYSNDVNELGLWSHLLTPQSYQVFYGKKYPFIVEVPVKEQYANKILAAIQYFMEARRYHTEIDYASNRHIGFNKLWLYNNRDHSGELRLIPAQKNNMTQYINYPKTNAAEGYREILAIEVYDRWKINSFFNQVKNNTNNIPLWKRDINDIIRDVNPDALWYSRVWQDRLRGDWFLARFQNDIETRFKLLFRWSESDERIIDV